MPTFTVSDGTDQPTASAAIPLSPAYLAYIAGQEPTEAGLPSQSGSEIHTDPLPDQPMVTEPEVNPEPDLSSTPPEEQSEPLVADGELTLNLTDEIPAPPPFTGARSADIVARVDDLTAAIPTLEQQLAAAAQVSLSAPTDKTAAKATRTVQLSLREARDELEQLTAALPLIVAAEQEHAELVAKYERGQARAEILRRRDAEFAAAKTVTEELENFRKALASATEVLDEYDAGRLPLENQVTLVRALVSGAERRIKEHREAAEDLYTEAMAILPTSSWVRRHTQRAREAERTEAERLAAVEAETAREMWENTVVFIERSDELHPWESKGLTGWNVRQGDMAAFEAKQAAQRAEHEKHMARVAEMERINHLNSLDEPVPHPDPTAFADGKYQPHAIPEEYQPKPHRVKFDVERPWWGHGHRYARVSS